MNRNGKFAITQILILMIGIIAIGYALGGGMGVVSGQNQGLVDSPLGGSVDINTIDSTGGSATLPTNIGTNAEYYAGVDLAKLGGNLPEGASLSMERGFNMGAAQAAQTPPVKTKSWGTGEEGVLGIKDSGLGVIANNFAHALTVAMVVGMVAGLAGLESAQATAVTVAASVGWFAGETAIDVFSATEWGSTPLKDGGTLTKGQVGGAVVGLVVAAIIVCLMYEKEDSKTVRFNCYSWEAPTGGNDCEKCNNENIPCSEYQCKALGQTCEVVNKGTGNEKCVSIKHDDTQAPVIRANEELLTDGFKYEPNNQVRPPATGKYIRKINSIKGCLDPFEPIVWGLTTDEPAQCKIDISLNGTFDTMAGFVGGSNLFDYNHTQVMSLPGPNSTDPTIELRPDQVIKLYVRCADANGNANQADAFEMQFCIDPSPDNTAPKIEATSLIDGAPFAFGTQEIDFDVYTNEPADCRWSKSDVDYDEMINTMSCAQSTTQMDENMLYRCSGELTGLKSGVGVENDFFFRCRDQPWKTTDRNTNEDSTKFTLMGTEPLSIKDFSPEPDEEIFSSTTPGEVMLEIETEDGYSDGQAACYFSRTGVESDYLLFTATDSYLHSQPQYLPEGNYDYYFKCLDLGGNAAYINTSFSVDIDEEEPLIVRAYHEGQSLKITTHEEADCVFSNIDDLECNFAFDEGTTMASRSERKQHDTEWVEGESYYIKCRDDYGNEPFPNDCSIVVQTINQDF